MKRQEWRTRPLVGAAAIGASATLLLATACEDGGPPPAVTEADSAGISIVTSDPLQSEAVCSLSDEPTFLVGDNQDDEAQWFSSVSGVGALSDGSVVVAERGSGQLRIYDRTGAHLRSMGRMGEGPGEFSRLWFLRVLVGDTVWVGDYRPMRYFLYASGGDWVRTIELDPMYLNPTRDGGVLANGISINVRTEGAERHDFKTPDTWHVEAHAPDGKLIGPVATVPARTFGHVKEDPEFLRYRPLLRPECLRRCTWAIPSPSPTAAIPEVRVLDEGLRLRRIIRWHDPGRQVTGGACASRPGRRGRVGQAGRRAVGQRPGAAQPRPASRRCPARGPERVGRNRRQHLGVPGKRPRRIRAATSDGIRSRRALPLPPGQRAGRLPTSGRWAPTTRWGSGRASSTCSWSRSTAWPGRVPLRIEPGLRSLSARRPHRDRSGDLPAREPYPLSSKPLGGQRT